MRIEYESNKIPIYRTITEDDEGIDTPEQLQSALIQIADDMGYTYIEKSDYKLGNGTISITNNVSIIVKYGTKITAIYVDVDKSMYNCTTNSSSIDDVSVALQTASMICSDIRKKLM